jgi:predicted nucleotidyltransferase
MSTINTSIDICEKLPRGIVPLYRAIDTAAKTLNIPYLVVGAMARDLVLVYGFEARIERGTRDIDFGIQVDSWDDFQNLKEALIAQGFTTTREEQRLVGPEDWDLSLDTLDLIPFGGIQDEAANISWPPQGNRVMNVLGFDEALQNATSVIISRDPMLEIPVASPQGMALLKLVAWTDRDADKKARDAIDFHYLMTSYSKIDKIDGLTYTEGMMERYDYDGDLASAYLLGKHTGEIAQPVTKTYILGAFNGDIPGRTRQDLMLDMSRFSEADRVEDLLDAFLEGFEFG